MGSDEHNAGSGDEGFKLIELPGGMHTIHSLKYGETLHPGMGPVAEAEALYVQQLQLPDRLRKRAGEFVVWDIGLGAAANALAVLRVARQLRVRLALFSFDSTLEPLRFAFRHKDALGYFHGYEPAVEDLMREQCAVMEEENAHRIRWELHLGDFPDWLARAAARDWVAPDAILFDAYSPVQNPAMWTLPLFTHLFRRLDPGRPCALSTYSRSTMVRAALLLAGFFVGTGRAMGRKEETTVAANTLDLIEEPLDRKWLERALRSGGAEPLHEPVYRQAPLAAVTRDQLRMHPQFQ